MSKSNVQVHVDPSTTSPFEFLNDNKEWKTKWNKTEDTTEGASWTENNF